MSYYTGPVASLETMPVNVIEGHKIIRKNNEGTEGIACTNNPPDPLPSGVSILTHEEATALVRTPDYDPEPEE
tara:strand:+ start:35 stop:253 length:219 start_codon:yes stop_codon:yes gene_type:complete